MIKTEIYKLDRIEECFAFLEKPEGECIRIDSDNLPKGYIQTGTMRLEQLLFDSLDRLSQFLTYKSCIRRQQVKSTTGIVDNICLEQTQFLQQITDNCIRQDTEIIRTSLQIFTGILGYDLINVGLDSAEISTNQQERRFFILSFALEIIQTYRQCRRSFQMVIQRHIRKVNCTGRYGRCIFIKQVQQRFSKCPISISLYKLEFGDKIIPQSCIIRNLLK